MATDEASSPGLMPVKENLIFENLTVGLVKQLEETPGIRGVQLMLNLPCERMILTSWEQRHSCSFPKDLKHFYLTTDGFKLIWNYEYAGEDLPIGNMKINSVSELQRIGGFKAQDDSDWPTPLDIEMCRPPQTSISRAVPNFGTKCKIFELDVCQGLGKVCLVYIKNHGNIDALPGSYTNTELPRIWLLDRCFEWHFLAEDFTTYFRMMLVHKGLPQWQFKFTPFGLTPWAEQIFAMLAPHLLRPSSSNPQENKAWDGLENLIDPAVFKLRSKSTKNEKNARE